MLSNSQLRVELSITAVSGLTGRFNRLNLHSKYSHLIKLYSRNIEMKCKAAVAWEVKKLLEIEEVEVEAPREGEVLLKVIASGVCHTDAFTLSGDDPEGAFIVDPHELGREWLTEARLRILGG